MVNKKNPENIKNKSKTLSKCTNKTCLNITGQSTKFLYYQHNFCVF